MREASKGGGADGSRWLLAALALVALGAAVFVAVRTLEPPGDAGDRPGGVPVADPPPGMQALVEEIAALRAELAQLRLALATAQPAATTAMPAPLAPSPTDPESLKPLVAALDRLAAQLGARLPAIEAPARQEDRRDELRQLLEPEREWTDEEWEAWEAEFERMKDRYFFWTEQRVLDTFGRPDAAHAQGNGTWDWEYRFSEDHSVTLHFAGGRVTDVWN